MVNSCLTNFCMWGQLTASCISVLSVIWGCRQVSAKYTINNAHSWQRLSEARIYARAHMDMPHISNLRNLPAHTPPSPFSADHCIPEGEQTIHIHKHTVLWSWPSEYVHKLFMCLCVSKGSQRFGGRDGTSDVHDLCTYWLLVCQSNKLLADMVKGTRTHKTSGENCRECGVVQLNILTKICKPLPPSQCSHYCGAGQSWALVTTKKPVGSWQMSVSHSAMSSLSAHGSQWLDGN